MKDELDLIADEFPKLRIPRLLLAIIRTQRQLDALMGAKVVQLIPASDLIKTRKSLTVAADQIYGFSKGRDKGGQHA